MATGLVDLFRLRQRPMKEIRQICKHCGKQLVMVRTDGVRVKFLYICANCDDGYGRFTRTKEE